MTVKNIFRVSGWRKKSRSMILNGEVSNFTKTFKNNFTTLLIFALGLLAALTWQEAIKEAVLELIPGENTVIYKFYIAITVTLISVTFTYFLSKFKTKE